MISFQRMVVLVAAVAGWGMAAAQTQDAPAMVLHVRRSEVVVVEKNLRMSTVWGSIGREKVELANEFGFQKTWVLKPGDYPVRLKKDDTADGKVSREYEVEVAPGKKVDFVLTGLEE